MKKLVKLVLSFSVVVVLVLGALAFTTPKSEAVLRFCTDFNTCMSTAGCTYEGPLTCYNEDDCLEYRCGLYSCGGTTCKAGCVPW